MKLLAALEESQQKVEVAKTTIESFGRITDDMEDEYELLQIKYGEAQQTIARQQKVIDWYESGGSMGELVEEGVQS
ncbi:hypothetical protein BSK64_06430 [Paenibacillus odorifer]|uniref:hypothetical protein n=1 Tax=Paenibacillus odorifer TaxID=189426 RepID=UPI00096D6451|nr:hypothetical protein [Paenibacillus odorifer]OME07887.1 hypothetical protein BSK64_06430 [Paenibacillus odorifer]